MGHYKNFNLHHLFKVTANIFERQHLHFLWQAQNPVFVITSLLASSLLANNDLILCQTFDIWFHFLLCYIFYSHNFNQFVNSSQINIYVPIAVRPTSVWQLMALDDCSPDMNILHSSHHIVFTWRHLTSPHISIIYIIYTKSDKFHF